MPKDIITAVEKYWNANKLFTSNKKSDIHSIRFFYGVIDKNFLIKSQCIAMHDFLHEFLWCIAKPQLFTVLRGFEYFYQILL